jgi:hypothetical protein
VVIAAAELACACGGEERGKVAQGKPNIRRRPLRLDELTMKFLRITIGDGVNKVQALRQINPS